MSSSDLRFSDGIENRWICGTAGESGPARVGARRRAAAGLGWLGGRRAAVPVVAMAVTLDSEPELLGQLGRSGAKVSRLGVGLQTVR